jgi:hypothetical protein
LQLLLGGLVAAADELRVGEAQLVGLVKTAVAQRAKALEELRKGGPLLVGPNGVPVRAERPDAEYATEEEYAAALEGPGETGAVRRAAWTPAELRAAGRPDDSSCRCQVWPCGCACHKPRDAGERAAVLVSGAVGAHDCFESWDDRTVSEAAPEGKPAPADGAVNDGDCAP